MIANNKNSIYLHFKKFVVNLLKYRKNRKSFTREHLKILIKPFKQIKPFLLSPNTLKYTMWVRSLKKVNRVSLDYIKARNDVDIDSFDILYSEEDNVDALHFSQLTEDSVKSNLPYHFIFNFRITSNNIFCHLTDSFGETVFPIRSSSFFKYKISDVNLKHFIENVLSAYYKSVKDYLDQREVFFPSQVVFRIFSAKKYRRKIISCVKKVYLETMTTQAFHLADKAALAEEGFLNPEDKPKNAYLTTPTYWFDIANQKPFNGCRVRKIKRKKRFRIRKFKLYR